MLTGRPVSEDFTENLGSFLENDNVFFRNQVVQDSTTGLLTIGYSYPVLIHVVSSGKTVYEINPKLTGDFAKIHKFSKAEIALLNKIAADLTKKNVHQAILDFDNRATGLLSFTITGEAAGDQAETLLNDVIQRDIAAAHLGAIATSHSMANTDELLALDALAYENPSLVTSALKTAVSMGQRTVAWLDILTTLNKAKSPTTETLRIAEANQFGLYSNGSYPTSLTEAFSVGRFLDAHEAALQQFLVAAGESKSYVTGTLLPQWYDGADYEFWQSYSDNLSRISDTNVVLAKSDKGGTIDFGKDLVIPFVTGQTYNEAGALVIGGKGNDTLIISGNFDETMGYGQTVLFVSGGGTDTVNESGLASFETLEIEAGPGKVNVVMPTGHRLEILKIDQPSSFKGEITGFASGQQIDLAGIGTATKATLSSNGVLSVTGGTTTVTLNLGAAKSYAGYKFAVQSDGDTGSDISLVPQSSHLITFSEYNVGTIITNQYQDDGVVFTGDPVKNNGKTTDSPCEIYEDSADPTSPALANFAHGDFSGPIIGHFVDPNTGAKGTVTQFSFNAGYFDNLGSTEVEWFNAQHKLIGSMREETRGYDHFNIFSATPIASFEVMSTSKEVNGFSLDNFIVGKVTG